MKIDPIKTYDRIYEIRRIAKGVYDIDEARLSTMYLIEGKKRALVIDCGIGIGNFKGVIEKMTALPYDVVISHAHVDHIGGRGQFEKLFLHKDDLPIIKNVTMRYRRNYKRMFLKGSLKLTRLPLLRVDKEPEIVSIEDGHIFDLGGKTVKVIHTSGHTLGSVCFHIPEDRLLLTADSFNPIVLLFLTHADTVENYIKSGEKILSLNGIDTYYGSHLRNPISREIIENTVGNARYVFDNKKNRQLSLYRFSFRNKCMLVYKGNNIRNS